MKKIKIAVWVAINLIVLAVLLFSVGIVLPRTYYFERSVVIDAPPAAIYSHVNNLREWPTWTAWTTKSHPGMTIEFGEKDTGTGAEYSWTIPNKGVGTVRITGANLGYGVGYALEMDRGKHRSAGSFKFKPAENGTRVIWTNEGELAWSPLDRYRGLMMDSTMGPDLQAGLENLKRKVESEKREPQATQDQKKGRKGKRKNQEPSVAEGQDKAAETTGPDAPAPESLENEPESLNPVPPPSGSAGEQS